MVVLWDGRKVAMKVAQRVDLMAGLLVSHLAEQMVASKVVK